MSGVVTFGEILLRLSCPDHRRFSQVDSFEVTVAGAEANVAVACACFGHRASFVSALPPNGMGDLALRNLTMWKVDTSHVVPFGKRLGVYYLETGALQRPAEIIYDREGSSFATIPSESYDWERILQGAQWFHTSGINPALSPSAAAATRQGIKTAKKLGIPVSFDLNYRYKLWGVAEARPSLELLLPEIDLLIAGRGQIAEVLEIVSPKSDFEGIEEVALQVSRAYGIPQVCIPRRGSGEALLETRSAVFYDGKECHCAPWMAFEMIEPLGGGDAFAGALISSLLAKEDSLSAIKIAVAAACVKHSSPGDFLKARREEVMAFIDNPAQRGIKR